MLNLFCPSSLYGKICLGKSNLWFAWVTVLCYQVASITRKHYIINLSLSTTSNLDHLIDVNKMVRDFLPNIFACLFSLGDNINKILP